MPVSSSLSQRWGGVPVIFSAAQILFTAGVTAVLTVAAGWWRLPRAAWWDVFAAGVLTGAAVAVWRFAANMGALNDDGLPGVSANDLAAPVLVFVVLTIYGDLRAPAEHHRFRQVRALATLLAAVVNVVTI